MADPTTGQYFALSCIIFRMKKLLLLPLLFLSFAQAQTIRCQVSAIVDDDRFACLTDQNEEYHVKLSGIILPAPDQPYGALARTNFSHRLLNIHYFVSDSEKGPVSDQKVFVAIEQKTDKNTITGKVYYKEYLISSGIRRESDIALWFLKGGLAWHDPLAKEKTEYAQAEQEARKAGRGLWADKNPVAPWEWRKKK